MKPQTITARHPQLPLILEWLKAIGVRHYIPEDARIVITGNWIIAPTFDIGRMYNPRYGYDRTTQTLKVKTRRYRIRHELRLIA